MFGVGESPQYEKTAAPIAVPLAEIHPDHKTYSESVEAAASAAEDTAKDKARVIEIKSRLAKKGLHATVRGLENGHMRDILRAAKFARQERMVA